MQTPLNPLDILIKPLKKKDEPSIPNPMKIHKFRNKNKNWRWEHSDLIFPHSHLLSHFTNSRPRFPFLSVIVTGRFRGAVRGQSGHLVNGTAPYRGHEQREDVPALDIYRWC
jgi:hypothetical protein